MIVTWSKGPADDCMPQDILVETLEKVRRHPWWNARAKLALAVLRRNGIQAPALIIDVGCGWGVNLEALEKAGYNVTGLDISRRILELIDHTGRLLVEADLNHDPPANFALQDGLLALDVLEHLDDDRGALCRLAKLVRPGGLAVVSVPALPELFSEFDRVQAHRRRYLPETLRAAFAGTGFSLRNIFWWGAWMVPVLRRMRAGEASKVGSAPETYADYLRLPPWPVPWLMKLAFAWEQGRALKGRLPIGTSLISIAVRQE
jgi:SAM-dependent methyltransferase